MDLSQQLAGSALISHLPAILTKAEQEVKALQAAVTQFPYAPHPSCSVEFQFSNSCFTNIPTVLLYKPEVLKSRAVIQSRLLEFASHLLDIVRYWWMLASLHPGVQGPRRGLEQCMVPAGRLAVATLQCLSTCTDKLPARPAVPSVDLDWVELGFSTRSLLLLRPSNCDGIAIKCTDAAAAVVAARTDCQKVPDDPCMLECLSTTALAMLQSAGSTSLAESHCYRQSLSLLRYNPKVFIGYRDAAYAMYSATRCRWWVGKYMHHIAAESGTVRQPCTKQQELHLLLPPLLLTWAASARHASPQHKPAGTGSDLRQAAAFCSIAALEHWASLQQEQDKPQVPASIAGPLLKELLPLVLDMLSDAVLAPSSAALAAPNSTPERPAAHGSAPAACDLISWLLQHTPATAQHSTPAAGVSDQGAVLLAAAAWRKHAPKLSTLLEAVVRSGPAGWILDPILKSNPRSGAEEAAYRRQGSCLQLLLDAAVAAKSTKAQLQHCSLLASLLKHSSAAVAANCTQQPSKSAPVASTGSSCSAKATAHQGHAGDSLCLEANSSCEGSGAQPAASEASTPMQLPQLQASDIQVLLGVATYQLRSGLQELQGLPVLHPPSSSVLITKDNSSSNNNRNSSSSSSSSSCDIPGAAASASEEAVYVLLTTVKGIAAALQAGWLAPATTQSSTCSGDSIGTAGSSSASGSTAVGCGGKGTGSDPADEAASTTGSVLQQWQTVLRSRCCMVVAEHLARLFGGGQSGGSCGSHSTSVTTTRHSLEQGTVSSSHLARTSCDAVALLSEIGDILCTWCTQQNTAQLPPPTGYNTADIFKAMSETAALFKRACASIVWADTEGLAQEAALHVAEFAGSLAVLGEALGAVATPLLCNNPSCSNLAGSSELRLVNRGKQKICAKCLCSRYCSVDCQRSSWEKHRRV